MQKLTIRFSAKGLSPNNLHVILDRKDVGVIRPGENATREIDNEGHILYFVYYVPAVGGNDVPISSEEIVISSTFDSAPEKLEYIFDVSIEHTVNFKETMKASFTQMFMSKQQQLNIAANRDFKVIVRQDSENSQDIERKQKINVMHYNVEQAMVKLTKHISNDIFEPLDFTEFDSLSEDEKHYSYMDKMFVPALVERTYAELVRHYLEDEISMRMMFMVLHQLTHIPYADTIIGDSFKHMTYLCISGNNINSVLHENVVDELEKLKASDFNIIHFKCLDQNGMRDRWNNRDKFDFMKREKGVSKALFDEIVNVDKDEKYFDDLKKSILMVAMIEREHPELSGVLPDIKLAMQETFGPIVYHKDKPIMSVTVDMLIADAIHLSKVNSIDQINDSLSTFLDILCPEFEIQSDQYCILQEVFAWLKAYKQEAMVLDAMVNNGIARTKEQDNRIAFLNSNKTSSTSNNVINYGSGYIHNSLEAEQDDNGVLYYDYRFMSMNDAETSSLFNSLSMENKTLNNAIVVDEWTNSIETQGIVWDNDSIKGNIDETLKKNFGDRFVVSIRECGVSSDGWMDTTPSIIITEDSGQAMPWLSFIISGEQIILNHMNISVYTTYRPNADVLSENVYERNQMIEKKVLMLRKKQNPKIINLIQIVTNLVVKELENWVNSQQTQNIYD